MSWEEEVRKLHEREIDMETDEFERLMAVAVTGERPDDPRLPLFLPLPMEEIFE